MGELFTDLEDEYGSQRKMNLVINPAVVNEAAAAALTSKNTVTFGKDSFEALIAVAFEI